MHVKLWYKGGSLTIVGGVLLFLGQQQACLSAAQRVVHRVFIMGLEVCQALDVDAVGGDTNEHGCQYGHIIQHPGLTTSLLCEHKGVHQLEGASVTGRHGAGVPLDLGRSKKVCRAYKL